MCVVLIQSQDESRLGTRQEHPIRNQSMELGSRLHRAWSGEVRFGWRAYRVKPSTNVCLRVRFTAEMARTVHADSFRIPSQHCKCGVRALDYEPVARRTSDPAADFATEFLKSCHTSARAS